MMVEPDRRLSREGAVTTGVTVVSLGAGKFSLLMWVVIHQWASHLGLELKNGGVPCAVLQK